MAIAMTACCWLLGVVFIVSAVSKLRSSTAFAAFTGSVGDMSLVPHALARPIALVVPIGEVLAAVLLLIPATTFAGAVTALVLLTVFTTAITLVLRRGRVASCRCFGASERPFGSRHLVRNALLIAVALAAAATSASAPGPAQPAAVLLAVCTGTLGALLVVMFDELVELFAPSTAPRP